MIRILFQNPQGVGPLSPNRCTLSSKINKLKETLLKHEVDILGLAEVNTDWRAVPQQQTWWSTTDGWFEHRRVITSINTTVAPSTRIQYGGTLLMTTNRTAYSVQSTESDTMQLGRWSSMLLHGKNNQKCRVICAYCPCISTGPTSTYALQVIGLSKQNNYECPRTRFWLDLKTYITKCHTNQEHIVIMGDWNSEYAEVTTWMKELGLKDIIQSRQGQAIPPPTCRRSRDSPIDAVFVTDKFTCWRGGYLSFDYLEGNHRGLWCDIPIEYILGYNMQHPAHPKARRLKTDDPRVCKKYLSTLHKTLGNTDVYLTINQLYTSAQQNFQFLPTDILHFEECDTIITQAMQHAEQKCRKLKTGTVRWSPLYQKACDRVVYWQLLIKERKGQHSNARKIVSLRKKLKIPIQRLTLDDMETSLKRVKQEQKNVRNMWLNCSLNIGIDSPKRRKK